MLRMRTEARHGLRWGLVRWGLLSVATAIAFTAVTSDPADARARRSKRTITAISTYSPPSAAIVVDANTGAVLYTNNADASRHPASLTKIMTLYLLFERLESGKLALDSQLRVSEHASDQAPTKLGLREGSTISVEDAIKGLVTRSANDAAVVIAENLAGSEEEFARQMTRKARALGMTNTVYRNASGLPDSGQVTTARDQATLGRAIQERYPRYYRYFSIRSFTFRGQRISNHNNLLGRVDGVDGIKTGYIRASGFNLVTSLKRNGRYVVAVVLGGASAGSRDARMRQLLAQYVDKASTRRTAPAVAEAPARDTPAPQSFEMASAASVPARIAAAEPNAAARRGFAPPAGSDEPIRPNLVRTIPVKPPPKVAKTAPASPSDAAEGPATTARAELPPALPPVAARAGLLGVLPVRPPAPANETPSATVTAPAPATARNEPVREASLQHDTARDATSAPAVPTSRPANRSGWIIQVGAFPDQSEAQQKLAAVKSKAARLLASASPFTETVQRGDTTLYRARFAGLDREQAEAACKFLKRNDLDCLAIRN
jgi:D-alanyl-D-alanine carboxypeptidase